MSNVLPQFEVDMELRKRKDKTVIRITENDLNNNQEKILTVLRKECVDLQCWFSIIVRLLIYYFFYVVVLLFQKKLRFIHKIF